MNSDKDKIFLFVQNNLIKDRFEKIKKKKKTYQETQNDIQSKLSKLIKERQEEANRLKKHFQHN